MVDCSSRTGRGRRGVVQGLRTRPESRGPADGLGAHNIYERVATANGGLTGAQGDADNILGSLKNTNGSLALTSAVGRVR